MNYADYAARSKILFARYWLAVIFAVVVGALAAAPQLLAIRAIGDEYRGIHLLTLDDNSYYVARMREILDGHGWISSPSTYEFKQQPPLLYPVGEYLYMWPVLFGVHLVPTLIFAKFFFPAVLFLLIYALLYALTDGTPERGRKLAAVTGGLLATTGYGLVDYQNILPVFSGTAQFFTWSLWARPVNPVTGAILLSSFLLLLLRLMRGAGLRVMVAAGALFALMFGYFFTWGMALSVVGVFSVIVFAFRDYAFLKRIALTIAIGFLFAAPYWYNMRLVANTPESELLYSQAGLILTHAPVMNKVLLLALFIFLPCFVVAYRKNKREGTSFDRRWWFCFALILGGFWALNQQVVTGRTVWPYHFVQYATPLAIVAVMYAGALVLRPRFPKLWVAGMLGISALTLSYGMMAARTYVVQIPEFRGIQKYDDVLSWLRSNASHDCVVLVAEGVEEKLTRLIPGFTQCNSYVSGWIFASVHDSARVLHNFLTLMRLDGVTAESAEAYLNDHRKWAHDYFYRDWMDFLLLNNSRTDEIIRARVSDFNKFMEIDFLESLKRNRIDYIASEGALKDSVLRSLHRPSLIGNFNGAYLYKL